MKESNLFRMHSHVLKKEFSEKATEGFGHKKKCDSSRLYAGKDYFTGSCSLRLLVICP